MQLPKGNCGSMVIVGLASTLSALGCSRATTESAASSESETNAITVGETPTLTTLFKAPLVVEGLTADRAGNLYTAGRQGNPCPVWSIPSAGGAPVIVGNISAPCSPNGLAFNSAGDLFIADGATETNGTTGDKIYRLRPDPTAPPTATLFCSGVPGANGIAFDRTGNLWVSDGTTGQGRIWSVTPDGTVTEQFRVPPLANLVNTVTNTPDGGAPTLVGGVGRDVRALPPGTLTITETTRAAANTAGSVSLVANGLAFDIQGNLLIADSARGAIWKAVFDHHTGALQSPLGCDTTFSPNTLCLKNVFVQHPLLEGLDGIALDLIGNAWGVANERNSVVIVTPFGRVEEIIRNPPDATTRLRNGGPLEFPTSPFLVGRKLCITQSDTARRDNFPNGPGEVGPGQAGVAKVSCLDQSVLIPGLPVPLQ